MRRAGCREGGRRQGRDRFMGRAAGRKEALVRSGRPHSCARRAPEGQEPGAAASGPAPEGLRLPRRPAPRPRAAGPGENHPPLSGPAPGAEPPRPSGLQARGPGCPARAAPPSPFWDRRPSPPDPGPGAIAPALGSRREPQTHNPTIIHRASPLCVPAPRTSLGLPQAGSAFPAS